MSKTRVLLLLAAVVLLAALATPLGALAAETQHKVMAQCLGLGIQHKTLGGTATVYDCGNIKLVKFSCRSSVTVVTRELIVGEGAVTCPD